MHIKQLIKNLKVEKNTFSLTKFFIVYIRSQVDFSFIQDR